MESKICIKCKLSKPLIEEHFLIRKCSSDGFYNTCKECQIKYREIYFSVNKEELLIKRNKPENIEKRKLYELNNSERILIGKKEYADSIRGKEIQSLYIENNKELLNKKSKDWYYNNHNKALKQAKEYNIKTGKITGTGESLGEKQIRLFLEQNQVPFKKEEPFNNYKFWFDFYLPNHNLIIEYDGEFHYLPIFGEKELNKRKNQDNLKTDFCKSNNIKLLRIPYWEKNNINQILTNNLI